MSASTSQAWRHVFVLDFDAWQSVGQATKTTGVIECCVVLCCCHFTPCHKNVHETCRQCLSLLASACAAHEIRLVPTSATCSQGLIITVRAIGAPDVSQEFHEGPPATGLGFDSVAVALLVPQRRSSRRGRIELQQAMELISQS